MSWVFRGGSPPRPDEAAFHARRMSREGFSKPYLKPTAAYRFARALYSTPMSVTGDLFYMSGQELFEYIVSATRDALEELGVDAVTEAALHARRVGWVKDNPLIVAEMLPWRRAAAILSAGYPAPKLELYVDMARKLKKYGFTWGSRVRRAVSAALASYPYRWHEYQAVKYPEAYRSVLRTVHPRPPSKELEQLWGWVVGKKPAPAGLPEFYEEFRRLADAGKTVEALQVAVDAGLPWEVVRSRLGGLGEVPEDVLREAARRLMSSRDIAMQARTIYERLGRDMLLQLLREKHPPPDAAARAALAFAGTDRDVAEAFARVADVGSLLLQKLRWRPRRIVLLVDESGSMSGGPARAAASIYLSTASIYSDVYLFNADFRTSRDYVWRPSSRDPLDVALEIVRSTDGGTPLYDAVLTVAKGMGKDDLLVVITDEMENASVAGVERLASRLSTNMLLMIVVGYPTAMMPVGRTTGGTVVYPAVGRSVDMLVASMEWLGVERELIEGVVRPEDVLTLLTQQTIGAGQKREAVEHA